VTATNVVGTTKGPVQEFNAPEDGPAQPLNTTPSSGPQLVPRSAQNAGQGAVTPGATNPVGNVTPSPKVTVLTNAQKLAKALKACKHKPKRQRASCKKQALNKYGTGTKKTGKQASKKGKKTK
jgi:hypothetical protein